MDYLSVVDVAGLRGIQPQSVNKLLSRYPAGHERAFPVPDERRGPRREAVWTADRVEELTTWRGYGKDHGRGGPKPPARIRAERWARDHAGTT